MKRLRTVRRLPTSASATTARAGKGEGQLPVKNIALHRLRSSTKPANPSGYLDIPPTCSFPPLAIARRAAILCG